MIDVFSCGFENFMSPPVLCFLLGVLAGFSRSDLYVPDELVKGLSMFLMFSIGLHGGIGAQAEGWSSQLLLSFACAIALSFFIPFFCKWILSRTTPISPEQGGLIAAHYGSISIVTFATSMEFLKLSQITYENFLIPMAALMETPAILAGFLIIHNVIKKKRNQAASSLMWHEVFLNGAIVLLLGGFLIGCVSTQKGLQSIQPFFHAPLKGVLCFFLLDLGLMTSRNFEGLKNLGWRLVLFGVYMPLLGAGIGALCGVIIGLSMGGTILLAVLTASASYIAVPAAMKVGFPHLDNSLSISLSLGLTFPFNIFFGIPLYSYLIERLYSLLGK